MDYRLFSLDFMIFQPYESLSKCFLKAFIRSKLWEFSRKLPNLGNISSIQGQFGLKFPHFGPFLLNFRDFSSMLHLSENIKFQVIYKELYGIQWNLVLFSWNFITFHHNYWDFRYFLCNIVQKLHISHPIHQNLMVGVSFSHQTICYSFLDRFII